MSIKSDQTLALLIDADNVSSKYVSGLLAEIAKYGTASVRRIYGDWTKSELGGWKAFLLEHSIQPIQQFAYTKGKNATDGAMIIDAMDLLYTGRFSGFCIASSDSDFARLAARIREQGVTVYGFGEKKTPRPFITACDKFTYFDVLNSNIADQREMATNKDAPKLAASDSPTQKPGPVKSRLDPATIELLKTAIRATTDDNGLAKLGSVGSLLVKQAPDFDPRNFGYPKLKNLVEDSGVADVVQDDKSTIVQVRLRTPKKPNQSK